MLLCVTSAVTSCKDDDEASQSYNFLESFGPCPVARGGELIFLGKDLSSVQSVEFPGGETAAPNFSGKGKFTVIVPSSAQPGYLILHTSNGDIKTVSEIGYSEPVTVSKFSPSEQRPGGEVTISGEYLSNATEIAIGQVKISLDEESAFNVFSLLKTLSKERLVIIACHNRDAAFRYADRIIEMKGGKIIQDVTSTPSGCEITYSSDRVFIPPEHAITVEELCEELMIGRNAAYSLLATNKIKGFRIGRIWKIPRESIRQYIKEQSKM